MSILNQYCLSFDKAEKDKTPEKFSNPTAISHHLSGYLMGQSVEFIAEDILSEINKAISGTPFDEDAGGFLSFLTIGPSVSTFSSINEADADYSIPTIDLKEILSIWVDWVNQHEIKTPGFSF
ncbi:hypothetical protein ACFFGT_15445 [Mucilaginibacter angelicae]|uniref:Uncharacterized protein n=1 Tax=Mucilaginibacter angelicae TaxID=869718 RepID=A0ABV6L837_9SPHI